MYQAKLKERLLDGSAPQLEVLLHYYAYGRPRQELDVTQNTGVRVFVYGEPGQVRDEPPALEDHS